MERDSILSHGASFLLHDRLLNSSDLHEAHICSGCGSLLATRMLKPSPDLMTPPQMFCATCESVNTVKSIPLPYVTRYLVVELAAMNIRISFDLKQVH